MESAQRVVFNFGKRETQLEQKSQYKTLNKCNSECKGIYDFISNTLLEALKRVLTVNKGAEMGITETDKQLVAYIIWEYALPLMNYDYVMEKCILPFFIQLIEIHDTNYFDYAITSLINFCSAEELSGWVVHVFRIIAEKMLCSQYLNKGRNYHQLFISLIKYQFILSAWLRSDNVFSDLEKIYFFHLGSESDIELFTPISEMEESLNLSKGMMIARKHYEDKEKYLVELTSLLMDERSIICSNGTKIIPRLIIVNFLDYLIKKNIKYVQEFPGNISELTHPSTIINFVFTIFSYLNSTVLSSPPSLYPFKMLYRADEFPEFVKLERMGGILSHLLSTYESEHNTSFKKISEVPVTASTVFHFSLFNKAIILLNYISDTEFSMAMRIFEKSLEIKQIREEYVETYNEKNKDSFDMEIRHLFLQSIPYQTYLFTTLNIEVS
jgi:hypothetical protein